MPDRDGGGFRVIAGAERIGVLLEFGFPSVFLDLVESRLGGRGSALSRAYVQPLHEVCEDVLNMNVSLANHPELASPIVPVMHPYDFSMTWWLVLRDPTGDRLVSWHPESGASEIGSALSLLTDLVIMGWEGEADARALVAWADELGHPCGARLVSALEQADDKGESATFESDRAWRDRFVRSCA